MKVGPSFAALVCCVACSSEARKLGELDLGGSSGGFDPGGSGGTPLGSGGDGFGGNGVGGTSDATGGTPGTVGTGGEAIVIGTGGMPTLTGGTIALTDQEHAALTATACSASLSESEQVSANVELVVDASASMGEPVAGANGLTKWEVTRDALLEGVVGVTGTGLSASTQVGMLPYPLSDVRLDERTCIDAALWIPRAPLGDAGSAQRSLIAERLLRIEPSGITSTFDAYNTVFLHDFATKMPAGSRIVVLVTDGDSTAQDCSNPEVESAAEDPSPIVGSIASANKQLGVRTIVIGTAGSEANRKWLSEAALKGGTAAAGCDVELGNCHIDLSADMSLSLTNTLASIVGSVPQCTFELPPPITGGAADVDRLTVVLNSGGQSALLLRSTQSDCSTGWILEGQVIRVCPESCSAVRDGSVEIMIACPNTTR
jgi:hypothetical protein